LWSALSDRTLSADHERGSSADIALNGSACS
jgi:hypothetical protein